MLPRDLVTFATVMTSLAVAVVDGAPPVNLEPEDYEVLADDETRSADNDFSNMGERRCYCNQPGCVPQGYMCRGKLCFTELPSGANTLLRMEQSTRSGCLNEDLKNRRCPAGYLCCNHEDLCNHVDSPAMKNKLNKTLQVLVGDQRAYLGTMQPSSHGSQGTTEGWFRTTTIAVTVGGVVVLLILASLAVRLLQPVPAPIRASGKLVPHRTSVNGPPLLGPPKVPLV
ncbi:BMP and activin membrane-bound inhibitor homolog [Odontomachus brunneus]|uniref:BMP and activin membrane-bound inhibitor homolog n=1 Tax=Odontomachus brunneus TaxID=486640 RepID=UPI0013F23329|nr:BMP and activin membrane-bound inhibitor homolog [Odontomachus brunneus]